MTESVMIFSPFFVNLVSRWMIFSCVRRCFELDDPSSDVRLGFGGHGFSSRSIDFSSGAVDVSSVVTSSLTSVAVLTS